MSNAAPQRSRQIIIAGGGIAGLTAALAFAAQGFPVRLFERSPAPQEAGAGLQLSPNATRILDRLGVLDRLRPVSIRPEAVVLRRASDLREMARVPLGDAALARWKSPYLVLHRADLHAALLAAVARQPDIEIQNGATVRDVAFHPMGVTASVDIDGGIHEVGGMLLVGADGVWSMLRRLAGSLAPGGFSGRIAWRATVRGDGIADDLIRRDQVTAFLHRKAHLIAYPIRGGDAVNLAAFTHGASPGDSWSNGREHQPLLDGLAGSNDRLLNLIRDAAPWTVWPIHTVDPHAPWINARGAVLIGDAAHAMTPFAAQGAASAIEDAWVLAQNIAAQPAALAIALQRYEAARRSRVIAVARRGRLNEFAWHASGPVALARNLFLKMRGPQRLASDLDWLYGWAPDGG
jgi:salicylate hydroxylase